MDFCEQASEGCTVDQDRWPVPGAPAFRGGGVTTWPGEAAEEPSAGAGQLRRELSTPVTVTDHLDCAKHRTSFWVFEEERDT